MRRLVSYVAAALAIIVVSAGLMAAPAQAGPQHYGTDPYSSGCSANSFAYKRWPFYINGQPIAVYTELWYSRICGTNWLVVTGNPAGGETVKVLSTDGGQVWVESDYGTGWSYGMQVYAPPGVCVHAEVALYHPNGVLYARVFEPAC